MNRTSKYKRLSLPFPFNKKWGDVEVYKLVNQKDYKKIKPVFNKNGWYYNRETKKS
jgi:hypothetical protein